MPRDVPYFEGEGHAAAEQAELELAPVASPLSVWAAAQRAFKIRKVEHLPLRGRLLDILEHLDRGHLLALAGGTLPSVWLDGHPDIALLAGVLFCYGYVEIAGRHRDNANIVFFRLSSAGERKLSEGRTWWNSLSFWQRLHVRALG